MKHPLYDPNNIRAVRDYLLTNQLTLSVAESVTSGHLQAAFASIEDTTKFFQGGITVYNLGQKARHLKIDPIHAETCNCISQKVAIEMAIHVTDLFSSAIGISITGYATPVPEEGVTDIFAWFAVAHGKEILICRKITSEKTDAVEAQIDYTNQVIAETLACLESKSLPNASHSAP